MMIAEEALLRQHRPHLNQQNTAWYSNELPDRSVKQAIVNEGVSILDPEIS